jgi:hypothetical protein
MPLRANTAKSWRNLYFAEQNKVVADYMVAPQTSGRGLAPAAIDHDCPRLYVHNTMAAAAIRQPLQNPAKELRGIKLTAYK